MQFLSKNLISLFTLHFVQFSRYNRLAERDDHKVASARFVRRSPSENQRLCPRSLYFVISQNHSSLSRLDDLVVLLSQGLVGLSGLEPPTSRLSGARSNRLSYKPISLGQRALRVSASLPYSPPPSAFSDLGGDEENRTPDPLLARQVLSQLSYTPMFRKFALFSESRWAFKIK